MDTLRSYGVPVVMACVAAWQCNLVHQHGLVSWRGGGFGMYASFHPRHHEVWVEHTDSGEWERFAKYDGCSGEVFQAVRPCLTWPSEEVAQTAWNNLPDEFRSQARLHVYRLGFDPETGVLSRVLLAEAPLFEVTSEEATGE